MTIISLLELPIPYRDKIFLVSCESSTSYPDTPIRLVHLEIHTAINTVLKIECSERGVSLAQWTGSAWVCKLTAWSDHRHSLFSKATSFPMLIWWIKDWNKITKVSIKKLTVLKNDRTCDRFYRSASDFHAVRWFAIGLVSVAEGSALLNEIMASVLNTSTNN